MRSLDIMASKPPLIFITEEVPYPLQGGGKIRDYSLLELLRDDWNVEVLAFSQGPDKILPNGIPVHLVKREKKHFLKRVLSPFRSYVANGYSQAMAEAIRERTSHHPLVWASRLTLAKYLPLAQSLGCRTHLDEHNVESDLLLRSVFPNPKKWLQLPAALHTRRLEAQACVLAETVSCPSPHDAALIRKLAPQARVHVIPNLIDCSRYENLRSSMGDELLFTGTLDYPPNVEGLYWFVEAVLPKLGTSLPRITVAGARPQPALHTVLERARIHLFASPESIQDLLRKASIVFVPLLSGSGTRLKILEAMASGRAVISTRKGAEGLSLSHGENIWLADTADEFASAIHELMKNADLRKHMGQSASQYADQHFDWRCFRDPLRLILRGGEDHS